MSFVPHAIPCDTWSFRFEKACSIEGRGVSKSFLSCRLLTHSSGLDCTWLIMIAHGWKKIPCSFISGYARFVAEIINYQYEIPTYYYYWILSQYDCPTRVVPRPTRTWIPCLKCFNRSKASVLSPSEKMLTAAFDLSSPPFQALSCPVNGFKILAAHPFHPLCKNQQIIPNIPGFQPSLYHRAEQLLESLPATCGNCRNCHFENTQHGESHKQVTNRHFKVSFTKVCPSESLLRRFIFGNATSLKKI